MSDGDVNLFDAPRASDEGDPAGYEVPYARHRPADRGLRLGMTVYELNEGNSICPYHYEYAGGGVADRPRGHTDPARPGRGARPHPGRRRLLPAGPRGAQGHQPQAGPGARGDALDQGRELDRRLPRQRQGRSVHARDMKLLLPRSAAVDYLARRL